MGIGRYFITLFIAAFASSLAYFLVHNVPVIFWLAGTADPNLVAGAISQSLVSMIIRGISLLVLGYLVWRFVSLIYLRPAGGSRPRTSYLLAGIFTHSIMFGVEQALYALGGNGFGVIESWLSIIAVVAAGAIWGLIFWLMDPRAHRDKMIAEDFA